MKRLLSILFLTAFSHPVFADEPPCWCEFSIQSKNTFFRADIGFNMADSLLDPWEREWTIKVYEIKSDTVLLWSSKFYHDGYGGGILSDDGGIYVYVNDWLDMKEPPNQVVIYTQQKTLRYSGKHLGLVPSNYPNTASHKIWVDEYFLTANYFSDSTCLKIETKDFKEITIKLSSGEIDSSTQAPKLPEEANSLRYYGFGLLVFIGLGVVLIVVKGKKQ